MTKVIRRYLSFWACVLAFSAAARAQNFVVPTMTGPVVDEAGIISGSERATLENLLFSLYRSGGSQIGVLTVSSLQGVTIEEAGIKTVESWKLGRQDKDDGILLIVAPKERRVRIEVGRGREGDLTDAYSRRIINQILSPAFKQGQYGQGIIMSVAAIIQKTDPTFDIESAGVQRQRMGRSRGENINPTAMLIMVIALFVLFGPLLFFLNLFGLISGGNRVHRYGRSGWGGGGGFGGFGGGGGGGGWSGGGGGFGGGGSSGSW